MLKRNDIESYIAGVAAENRRVRTRAYKNRDVAFVIAAAHFAFPLISPEGWIAYAAVTGRIERHCFPTAPWDRASFPSKF